MANAAKTTTSVSTFPMSIWWWPCCAACDTCSSMRLSACSWLHGARCGYAAIDVYRAPPSHQWEQLPRFLYRTPDVLTLNRKLISSVLLVWTRRKFCQCPGTGVFPTTHDTVCRWEEIYGMNTCWAYSSNVLAAAGFISRMMRAPSRTIQIASGVLVWEGDM